MHIKSQLALLSAALLCSANPLLARENDAPLDANGREIIHGPVASGKYAHVHIVSKTVGVFAILPTSIVDSEIEAPVCVSTSSRNLILQGNVLNCALCIEFTDGFLLDINIADNVCMGQGTNRPETLGW